MSRSAPQRAQPAANRITRSPQPARLRHHPHFLAAGLDGPTMTSGAGGRPSLMAKLIYTSITSLDGYVADASGSWDWSFPDEEIHAFVNDLERPIGTHLYGRKLYEVLKAWETMDDPAPAMRDYATLWRASEKIEFSRTLDEVSSERTRIEREFDPEAVRALKDAADSDVGIGGPHLAAAALRADRKSTRLN